LNVNTNKESKDKSTFGALIIAISARALFDLEKENALFEEKGLQAYQEYQRKNENQLLQPGTALPLVAGLLGLNGKTKLMKGRLVEVVIMSRNSPDLSLRIFKSIEYYNLDIKQAVFSSGARLHKYFASFKVDLFLSRFEDDVTAAINSGIAAAVLYSPPEGFSPNEDEIRIAFDGDAVLFSEESEIIYKKYGLEAFIINEKQRAMEVLPAGPFARLLKTLSVLQKRDNVGHKKLKLALITARSSATHERVIRTFREWDVHIDQAFFLGGMSKDQVLETFSPHIFFDDQDIHGIPASKVAPSGKVPYSPKSPLHKTTKPRDKQ